MIDGSDALTAAEASCRAGLWEQAESLYRGILAAEPDRLEVLGRLVALLAQSGRGRDAQALLEAALDRHPAAAELHNNLGTLHLQQKSIAAAIDSYRRALELRPEYAAAAYNLAVAYHSRGARDAAIAAYRKTLELAPGHFQSLLNLGQILMDRQEWQSAEDCWVRALDLQHDDAACLVNLGALRLAENRWVDAVESLERALRLDPDNAQAHSNLGLALLKLGRLEEAVRCQRRALELWPGQAEILNNLADALAAVGHLEDAAECCRQALESTPTFAPAINTLGLIEHRIGHLDVAADHFRHALELAPDHVPALCNLGNVLRDHGEVEQALDCYRRALALQPGHAAAHSNLLYFLQFSVGATPAVLAAAHAEYERRHAAPLVRLPIRTDAPDRPRRIGFVSPDFGQHPIGYFLAGVLPGLAAACETCCYSDRARADDLTHRLRASANRWCDVTGWDDASLAERIRADRIDVLFDLTGHTAGNRLLMFARRPAPFQITWISSVGTTGLLGMDAILADHHVAPPGADANYGETVLRMPECYLCYAPPSSCAPVAPLPASRTGCFTFGSFNHPAKLNEEVLRTWAEILARSPGTRLVLKYTGLDSPPVSRRVRQPFAHRGIHPDRVELSGFSPHADTLSAYAAVDLALDPFPYSGCTTTCESLWMGVPVLTRPGLTFAGRQSLGPLHSVGLSALIADDSEDYVRKAVAWSRDLARLAEIRRGLRDRMAGSPLCDGDRFARNLYDLLVDAWKTRRD